MRARRGDDRSPRPRGGETASAVAPTAFRRALRGLSADEFVELVADLWIARGYEVDVDAGGRRLRVRPGRGPGDERVLAVAPVAGLPRPFDRLRTPAADDATVDAVVAQRDVRRARAAADALDADLVRPDDLREAARHGTPVGTRRRLFLRYFGRPPATFDGPESEAETGRGNERRYAVAAVATVAVVAAALALGGGWLPWDGWAWRSGPADAGPVVLNPWFGSESSPSDAEAVPASLGAPGRGSHAWATLGGDPSRDGYSSAAAGPTASDPDARALRVGESVSAAPVVVDGDAYVATSDGRVHAVNVSAGRVRWTSRAGDGVVATPAVDRDRVYVGAIKQTVDGSDTRFAAGLVAYDARDGSRQWGVPMASVAHSPAVVGGTVYAGTLDGRIYAVDAENGSVRWDRSAGGQVLAPPAVADGTVFVGATARLAALDAADGSRQWTTPLDGRMLAAPAVGDGTVIATTDVGSVYAVDADDGRVEWNRTLGTQFVASAAVRSADADSGTATVFAATITGRVYALDAENGSVRWNVSVPGMVYSSPAVAGGELYFGTTAGRVYAVDAENGSVEWNVSAGGGVRAAPAVVDGTVYVTTHDGTLVAVGHDPRTARTAGEGA